MVETWSSSSPSTLESRYITIRSAPASSLRAKPIYCVQCQGGDDWHKPYRLFPRPFGTGGTPPEVFPPKNGIELPVVLHLRASPHDYRSRRLTPGNTSINSGSGNGLFGGSGGGTYPRISNCSVNQISATTSGGGSSTSTTPPSLRTASLSTESTNFPLGEANALAGTSPRRSTF